MINGQMIYGYQQKIERDGFGSNIGHQMCGSVTISWLLLLAQRTPTCPQPIETRIHDTYSYWTFINEITLMMPPGCQQ